MSALLAIRKVPAAAPPIAISSNGSSLQDDRELAAGQGVAAEHHPDDQKYSDDRQHPRPRPDASRAGSSGRLVNIRYPAAATPAISARSSRSFSRCQSRSLIDARLSWSFLPLARPSSTLAQPRGVK